MITPPNGKVLDPFNGSGTTGVACTLENFEYTGIELDADYCKISEARINEWSKIDEYEQYKYRGQEDKGSTNSSPNPSYSNKKTSTENEIDYGLFSHL
jgi:DNA modification methylase